MIELHSDPVEHVQNCPCVGHPGKFRLSGKSDHVLYRGACRQFEVLLKLVQVSVLTAERVEEVLVHLDLKVDPIFGVVFSQAYNLFLPLVHDIIQRKLVVFRPFPNRQLIDDNSILFVLVNVEATGNLVACPLLIELYSACEILVPGVDLRQLFGRCEFLFNYLAYLAGVVVGDGGAPAGAYPLAAVDQDHGDDGDIELGLH